jgi:hypothetical protein
MKDRTPEPKPDGFLDPPRRFPPTAVGVATPPPPRGHRRNFRGESRLRRRVKSAARLLLFLSAGATLGSILPLAASATILAGLSASLVALRIRLRRWKSENPDETRDVRAA